MESYIITSTNRGWLAINVISTSTLLGYDARAKISFPVLYLLHGYAQLTSSWTETGFANVILDHLIDEGKAKPMIVVIPVANGGCGNHHRWPQGISE